MNTTESHSQDFVTWHEPSGAWYSTALILFGVAGFAYLPLAGALLGAGQAPGSGHARTAVLLAIAIAAVIIGIVVAVYPRPEPTRSGYVRDTVKRCVRGGVCGVALAWSILSFVDSCAFGVAPFNAAWLTALTQLAGLTVAAVLWDPGQQRILRAWYQTVKGYSMSDTGAAQ